MLTLTDSHIHFWDPARLRYTWLDDLPALNRAFLPDHAPARGDGWSVDALVFVEAACAPEQAVGEADWVTELEARDPRVRGIVAFAPLEQGKGARPVLDQLRQRPLVRGIRRLIQSEGPGFCTQPDFVAGVQMLAEYGFSFDLCIFHPQMGDATALVRQCPEVRFVPDHIGKPGIKPGLRHPWWEQMAELAALPNVWCKLSGLVTEADWEAWTPADLRPYIDRTLEVFGPGRVMFGSDSPVAALATTYSRWVETALDATRSLSAAEREQVFSRNARAFYRLDWAAPPL